MPMRGRSVRRLLVLAALLALGHLVLLAVDSLAAQAVAALILMVVLPGEATASLLLGRDADLDLLDRVALSAGLGYAWMGVGTLALSYLPGALTQRDLLLFFDGVILLQWVLGLALSARWPPARLLPGRMQVTRGQMLALGAILVVAMALRLPNLGYSEFQGDEGRAMLRAAEVLQGNDEVLFLHKKGPIEILYPAGLYGLMGQINEGTARLPFALANLMALLSLFALGRRLVGAPGALVAVGLMAVDGFWIGFSRIVQYQSVVLLMTLTTVLCAYRVYQGARRQQAYLVAAAGLAGAGMLAHYEGFFAVPVAAYLIGAGLWTRWRSEQGEWGDLARGATRWLPALALGALIVGAFYIPFVLDPHFGETATYLGEKRVGDGLLYNNIGDFFLRASYYNPTYYPLLLGVTLLGATGMTLWRGWRHWAARVGLIVLAVAALTMILFPSAWQVGSVNLSVVMLALVGGLVWLLPLSTERRVLVLWLVGTALLYFFLMLKVHTHYYVTLPPWSLLVGGVLAGLAARARRAGRGWWFAALGVGGVFWALCGAYGYLVFVRHTPEYRFNYPQAKPAIYWTPYGSVPPRGGYFGFPYRTAWKAVGGLYAQGILTGAYDSNQEDLVTNWYTRGAMRCPDCDYFIVARDVEDWHAIIPGVIDGGYMPAMEIVRDGVPQIWIYERGYQGDVVQYRYEDLAADFDRSLSRPVFQVGAPLDEQFDPSHQVGAHLGDSFDLVGWDLDHNVVRPGENAILTLYWRTVQPNPANHHVFAHIGDDNPVAQADSMPQCGLSPTYRWVQGQEVVDRYVLRVRSDAPDGVYPLRMGMYDINGGGRLHITDAQGNDVGSSLLLTTVRVGSPVYDSPTPAQALDVSFGDSIRLLGYDLSPETGVGGTVSVTLYWQALRPMDLDYTVFLHLVDGAGRVRGQVDQQPQGGGLPTDRWVAGEDIVDTYSVPLNADATAGSYHLTLGLYDQRTWGRLPARGADGTQWLDDAVDLSMVTVHDN